MSESYAEVLSTALDAAQRAGEIIRGFRANGGPRINEKKFGELVSEADIAADTAIVDIIRERYPKHHFLSEEGNSSVHDDTIFNGPLWVIDPIDGTTNYLYGHHHVGISIAYMVDRVVQVGVVYLPFLDEMFSAIKGGGAFLNGEPISVSNPTSLREALVATGLPYDRSATGPVIQRIGLIVEHCRDLRRIGAASVDLCYVACGRLDAYYEGYLKPWDLAAGLLIAKEAGASAGTYVPRDTRLPEDLDGSGVLVAGPGIYTQCLSLFTL